MYICMGGKVGIEGSKKSMVFGVRRSGADAQLRHCIGCKSQVYVNIWVVGMRLMSKLWISLAGKGASTQLTGECLY